MSKKLQLVAAKFDRRRPFVDQVKVLITSGCGGDGASIMSHEHSNELAGPGGGNGGRGGNVFLRCSRKFPDLSHIKSMGAQVCAGMGSVGFARTAHGRNGDDLWLDLPVGTQLVDVDTNSVLYDLDTDSMEVLLLEGGSGGKGNAAFANRWYHSPLEATKGLPGNTILAQIELKMIADCALVGFPNAGKSTFLGAVSTSQPKVAPYAFTTIHPTIGVVYDALGHSCSIADLPGLIEGAYENRGLGHQFLRHVERASAIAVVLDMVEAYDTGDRSAPLAPWEVLDVLLQELEYYAPGLQQRVVMVLANKCDVRADPQGALVADKVAELRRRTPLPVFPVAAALGRISGAASQAGLGAPIKFLCDHVFAARAKADAARKARQAAQERQLDAVFQNRHHGSYSGFRRKGQRMLHAAEGDDGVDGNDTFSLVDQQLANLVGSSGHGEAFSAYGHLPEGGNLRRTRDLTLDGRAWSVSKNSSRGSTQAKQL
jgi:GTP-binding protein